MSATLLQPSHVQTPPEDAQGQVFFATLRLLAANNADRGVVPLWDGNVLLGYFVHPKTPEAELVSPPRGPSPEYLDLTSQLPPEATERLRRPIPENIDFDDILSAEELTAIRLAAAGQIR